MQLSRRGFIAGSAITGLTGSKLGAGTSKTAIPTRALGKTGVHVFAVELAVSDEQRTPVTLVGLSEDDPHLGPHADLVAELGGNRVVERLAEGGHVGEHPHDAFRMLVHHGGSLAWRWVGRPSARLPTGRGSA